MSIVSEPEPPTVQETGLLNRSVPRVVAAFICIVCEVEFVVVSSAAAPAALGVDPVDQDPGVAQTPPVAGVQVAVTTGMENGAVGTVKFWVVL
jgi:hypothetical protein